MKLTNFLSVRCFKKVFWGCLLTRLCLAATVQAASFPAEYPVDLHSPGKSGSDSYLLTADEAAYQVSLLVSGYWSQYCDDLSEKNLEKIIINYFGPQSKWEDALFFVKSIIDDPSLTLSEKIELVKIFHSYESMRNRAKTGSQLDPAEQKIFNSVVNPFIFDNFFPRIRWEIDKQVNLQKISGFWNEAEFEEQFDNQIGMAIHVYEYTTDDYFSYFFKKLKAKLMEIGLQLDTHKKQVSSVFPKIDRKIIRENKKGNQVTLYKDGDLKIESSDDYLSLAVHALYVAFRLKYTLWLESTEGQKLQKEFSDLLKNRSEKTKPGDDDPVPPSECCAIL